MSIKKLMFLSLLVLPFLGACNPFLVYRPNSDMLREKGWAKYTPRDVYPAPLYCYNTLGDKVCRPYPLPGQEPRLSGFYGPEPVPQGYGFELYDYIDD